MYNRNMNFRVTVNSNQKNIATAIRWASDYIGTSKFNLTNNFPNSNWFFEFDDSKDANFFALRWA